MGRRIRDALHGESGVAAIEFGLIAALLLPIFVAAVDIGLALRQRLQIDQVLNMGAQAAMNPGATATDIRAAMAAAAGAHAALGALQLGVDGPQCFCRDAPDATVSCTSRCADSVPGRFFEITAEMEYDALLGGNLLPAEILTLRSRLRIEVLPVPGA